MSKEILSKPNRSQIGPDPDHTPIQPEISVRAIPRRLQTALLIAGIFLTTAGLIFTLAGVFAVELGLDNDAGWGKGRIALVIMGALLLVAGIIFLVRTLWKKLLRADANPRIDQIESAENPQSRIEFDAKPSFINNDQTPTFFYKLRVFFAANSWIYAVLAAVIVILVYLWFITAGKMTTWTPTSTYYDRLANAFRAGQVALLEQPGQELKALADPYDWRNREGIDILWDASYYNGHFYLYWGPAPALLAALVKTAANVTVEDQYLLFFFCLGLVLFFGLSLDLIRKRLFPRVPPWTVFLFTLMAELAVPVLWLTNRPGVYETAISGGQFFLVLGLYFILNGILRGSSPGAGWLAAAGLAWGAAVACRLNLVLAVGFFTAAIGWYLIRRIAKTPKISLMAALIVPLVIWAAGLAWYNAARFGNIFETGHRYQLTGPALPQNYSDVSSPAYILPNLYNYVFRPLSFSSQEFPFVHAPYIAESMWPRSIQPPENYYYSEPVAGILPAVPVVVLALLPLVRFCLLFWDWLNERPARRVTGDQKPGYRLVWTLALGGFGLLLAPLMIFISSSMRYLADAVPFGILLTALGFWWAWQRLMNRSHLRRLLNGIAIILVAVSISFSLLANFGSGDKRVEANNPALYYQITNFFSNK